MISRRTARACTRILPVTARWLSADAVRGAAPCRWARTPTDDGTPIAEHVSKVIDEYDPPHARKYYQHVLGGGGHGIRYGIFRSAADTAHQTSLETSSRLITSLDWIRPVTPGSMVLDLGSGHGGISHELARRFGCSVHGLNLSENQNEVNLAEAARLGIADKVHVVCHDFNNPLPPDYDGTFTHIISCDAMFHAYSKQRLVAELYRVLAPGGAIAFTDMCRSETASSDVLEVYTAKTPAGKMTSVSEYTSIMQSAGFRHPSFVDFSAHLVPCFQQMLDATRSKRELLLAEGCPADYLDKWEWSLDKRIRDQLDHEMLVWGIFSARKF